MQNQGLFSILDRVLRGDYVRQEQLATGRIEVPTRRLIALGLLLGGLYGFGVGSYALFRGADQAWLQALTAACKVPLLFLCTLLVTFPSLYVFAALQRLPLDLRNLLRLLLVAILVHLTILASLAPVFAFFAASTKSYAFMLLLNVACFAVGGMLGLGVLRRATLAMFAPPLPPANTTADAAPDATPDADGKEQLTARQRVHAGEQAKAVLRVWCLVYGIVGAQMGWLLRPFLGAPDLPFTLFRPREDSVFIGIVRAIGQLFTR